MNKKQIISILLIAVLIFTSIPIGQVQAASPINPNPLMTPAQFAQYLVDHDFPLTDSQGKPANLQTFNFYGLVVYDVPWGIPTQYSPVTKKDEYRYLGYDRNHNNYTNTYYPNDDRGSKTPIEWTYDTVPGADISWDTLKDPDHKAFMQNTNLGFLDIDGKTVLAYNSLTINSKIGPTKARLQNAASFKNGFSVYTLHTGDNGKQYYATLYGPPMSASTSLSCSITSPAENAIYYIRAGQTSVTVPVTTTATAILVGPYVKPKHIKSINVSFMGKNNPLSAVTTSSLSDTITYTREQLGVGEHPQTLNATATMQSTFEDAYASNATRNIKIIVETNDPNPYATATIDADDSKQFTGDNIPINVTMTGTIHNLTDVSKIDKVFFHINPIDLTAPPPIELPPALTVNSSCTITVPASKLFGVASYTQEFLGRVQYIMKDGTSYWGPPIGAPAEKTSTYIYKVKPPENANIPPIPIITAPDSAEVGSSFLVSGTRSYDPDGFIEEYSWYFREPDLERPNKLEDEGKSSGSVSYKFAGRKQIILGVTDDKGAYSEVEKFIEVTPPHPVPIIQESGTTKVNRKITVDASPSFSHPNYPINHSLTTWTVTPVTVGITASDIKSNSFIGVKFDFLVKKPGKYKVTLTVTNAAGMSSSTEKMLDIVPDIAPIADFVIIKEQLRNPSNYNKAQIILNDKSYCIDGDYINKRIWRYAYDSDNDGLFTDETWTVIDSRNNTQPSLYVYDVGKYAFELEVEEAFGQPTIPEFIALADLLKANTDSKLAADKIVEVINLAPIADISATKPIKVDLVVATDYTGSNLTNLQTKLTQYITDSFSNKLDVSLNLITNKKHLGRYLPEGSGGFNTVQNETTPKYKIADWNGLTEYSDHTYTVSHTTSRLWTNITTVTNDTFPAYVKKSIGYNNQSNMYGSISPAAKLWLLENGDLYFMGTNSTNNAGYYAWDGIFTKRPTKILSGVKDIQGGDCLYFILLNNGDVYAIGHTLNGFWQPAPYFTTSVNNYDITGIIPSRTDEAGTNPFNYYSHNSFTGYGNAVKVNGLSGVNYIWSSGTAFIARTSNGKWYGFGRGLNAFGLNTGYQNKPPKSIMQYSTGQDIDGGYSNYTYKVTQPFLDTWYLDNVNTLTELTNLSALNKTLGGIEKVAPNKVYTRSGEVYSITETPTIWMGQAGYSNLADIPAGVSYSVLYAYPQVPSYTVYFPFQVFGSAFTYNKTGTWTKAPTKYTGTYDPPNWTWTPDYIQTNGVPIEPFLSELEIPLTGQKEMYQRYYAAPPPVFPAKNFTNVRNLPICSGITNYNTFVYTVDYTYSHRVYDPTIVIEEGDDEDSSTYYGGYRYYYNYAVRPKVMPFERPLQAGRRAYGMDFDNINSVSLRPDAIKYMLYLDENDSFKKIKKDVLGFIQINMLNTRVSAKSEYLDGTVEPTTEINLRQFVSASLKGKIYGENAIDQMLLDITNENKVNASNNRVYVLLNEDKVDYLKYYNDYENDIMQAERFKYDHNPYIFDNGLGVASYSGQWLPDIKYTFDKVGSFVLTYQAQDNPKNDSRFTNYWLWSKGTNQLEILVHRRPIANFLPYGALVNPTTKTLYIKNMAYDLDHQLQPNKGIVTTEYKWRFVNDATWQVGYPSTVTAGNPIYVWQRVLDEEGVWSYPITKLIEFDALRNPPVAQFSIAKNPILENELLKLRDTSFANEGTLTRWHWVVEKLSDHSIVQNSQFINSNAGAGDLGGFDSNVKTDYESLGPGSYKIHLRVKDSNNLWSDAGTDAIYDLNSFYSQTLMVNEGLKLFDFRVSIIRDLQLANYYKSPTTGKYPDKPIYVSNMAIDGSNFGIAGLTKGYMFEFQIDSINFNGSADTIEIEPHYYTTDLFTRDIPERDLYWEDSNHKIWKAGQGAHAAWDNIILTASNRTIKSSKLATWRGEYLIPGTAWAVPHGTSASNAKTAALKRDIIINFQIKGYKAGVLKYNYNLSQWPLERTYTKKPYLIGDVIKYDYSRSNLDDIKFKDNR